MRVIDRKLEVQQETEQQQALQAPIVKASDEGFSLSSPNGDYRIRFAGNNSGRRPLLH